MRLLIKKLLGKTFYFLNERRNYFLGYYTNFFLLIFTVGVLIEENLNLVSFLLTLIFNFFIIKTITNVSSYLYKNWTRSFESDEQKHKI